ncbi:MAG: hypothetical protein R3A79_10210 [Nannocystaceae bacterium]
MLYATPTLLAALLALASAPEAAPEAADAPPIDAGEVEAADEPAPAVDAPPARSAPTALPSNLDPYSSWTLRLDSAIQATNDDPASAGELAAALDEAPSFTSSLANDDAARNDRNTGLLALARAYLVSGQRDKAVATMDEALRSAGSDPLDVARFGPTLGDLHRERVAALEHAGRGSIKVECAAPCRVYLNEHPAPSNAQGLFVGPYRVHVESSTNAYPPHDEVVVVAQAGQEIAVGFPPGVEGPARPDGLTNGPGEGDEPEVKKAKRILPRWLEVTAMVGGLAAAGAGTFLVLANDRCVGDFQTTPTAEMPGTCADIYDSRVGGLAAIGAGAAFFAGGVITLSIDESRARRTRKAGDAAPDGRTVMIGYTRRF